MLSHRAGTLFSRALMHLGQTRGDGVSYVQIGAMDGKSFDEAAPFIREYRWTGLSVEPNRTQFARLVVNRAGDGNKFERAAIVERDGPVEMIEIDPDAIDAGLVQSCFAGMSAVWPPRNGLGRPHDAAVVARHGRRVTVPGRTLQHVLDKHGVEAFDLLLVDTEGYDATVFLQLDLARYRPLVIRLEVINLTETERAQVRARLLAYGYEFERWGENLDAVADELWRALPGEVVTGTSLVTAFFDLGDGNRSRDDRSQFVELLRACAATPMIVYVDPETAALVRDARAGAAGTDIRTWSVEDFRIWFPFFQRVQQRRPDPDRCAIALSRMFLLHDAVIFDPHRTAHFLWVDADITRTVPAEYFSQGAVEALAPMLDRCLFVCTPPDGLVCGALFGGGRQVLSVLNAHYYDALKSATDEGLICTEDHVLSTLLDTCRDEVRVELTDAEGGVRHFLERVLASRDHG